METTLVVEGLRYGKATPEPALSTRREQAMKKCSMISVAQIDSQAYDEGSIPFTRSTPTG